MKVFISWSGEQSRQIAEALRDWLPMVVQAADVYMSARDNEAGVRWNAVVSAELDGTDFGILCLTPQNLEAPWVLFEAGALGKAVDRARVVPLLYKLTPTNVLAPLNQFMMQSATREGVRSIITSLNNTSDNPVAPDVINGTFGALWPRLEAKLQAVHQPIEVQQPERSERDLLEEILQIVRSEQRRPKLIVPASPPLTGSGSSVEARQRVREAEDRIERAIKRHGLTGHVVRWSYDAEAKTAFVYVNLDLEAVGGADFRNFALALHANSIGLVLEDSEGNVEGFNDLG